MIRIARSIALLGLLVAPALARAQPVEVSMVNQVQIGKKPTLTVKALTRVNDVVLELVRREDESKVTARVASMSPGQSRTFTIGEGLIGPSRFEGTLRLNHGAGEAWSSPIDLDTMVNSEIRVGYQREHLFLDKHVLEFQISRPSKALEAELQVFGDQGEVIGRGEQTFTDAPAGKWLAIPWEPSSDSGVMMMKLHIKDGGGWAEQTLTPWSVSIPHEDVNFASNSAEIAAAEQPKLDEAYAKIVAEVAKAQRLDVKCSLFIYGHTDTVGPRDKNQKLSLERAKSIATFLRRKGLTIKVSYEGFGEDRLKVQTPDETDEPANRRADYTLSAEAPPSLGTVFRWKEVK